MITTILEDYVSFETAKLLKEKGFDEPCRAYWDDQPKLDVHTLFSSVESIKNSERVGNTISCPTHQMAMKWLREKHIVIVVEPDFFNLDYDVVSWKYTVWFDDNAEDNAGFTSYEETVEAALKYSLENLI